jgi:hypothetical protein
MKDRISKNMLLTCLFGAGVLISGGCLQSEGKPCQTDSDCKNGLKCCFDSVTGQGTCQESCIAPDAADVDAAAIDASDLDGAQPDASPDAAEMDASEPDAAEMDASEPDSGVDATVDASPQ